MKRTLLRQLRNQFAVAASVIAMAVQFILLENYVNADVRAQYGEFNNNFVWMYALFFAFGGLICMLMRMRTAKLAVSGAVKPKDRTDISLALWGSSLIIVAFLSVGFVQTIVPAVGVSRISAALPLVYTLILCASGLTHYAMFTRLFARVKEDGASLLAPICGGIVFAMVALIIIPRQMSYKVAITLSGALLILGALVYAKGDATVRKYENVRPVERTNDTSGALTFVLLGLMTFGITFLFVNIDNYAAKLQFTDIEVYLLVGFCAGGAYLGNAFFKKFGRVSGLWSVIDFVVLTLCMFTVCFAREYLAIAFLVLVASVCFAVIVRDILGNILNWDKMRHEGYRYLIIVAGFIVPMILGYAGGTAATQGHGYMTDIFAGVNGAIETYALRARGVIPKADGTFADYIGIGTRLQVAEGRYEYVPSRYLPMIPMACMIIGSLFYMVSQMYNIRTSVHDTSVSKRTRQAVRINSSPGDMIDEIIPESVTTDVVASPRIEEHRREREETVRRAKEKNGDVEYEEIDDEEDTSFDANTQEISAPDAVDEENADRDVPTDESADDEGRFVTGSDGEVFEDMTEYEEEQTSEKPVEVKSPETDRLCEDDFDEDAFDGDREKE